MKRNAIISAALFALTLAPHGTLASSLPQNIQDQVELFARCTGRLSAQVEFEWLHRRDGHHAFAAQRDQLAELLDAVIPAARDLDPLKVLSWRIQAKHAHAALLRRTETNNDPRMASIARRMTQSNLSTCTAIVLS